MNVAITRAKHFLFVVGNSKTLEKNKVWKDYVRHSQDNASEGGYFKFLSNNQYTETNLSNIFFGNLTKALGSKNKEEGHDS